MEYIKGISPDKIDLMDNILTKYLNEPSITTDPLLIIKNVLRDAKGNAFTELEVAILFLNLGVLVANITQMELNKVVTTICKEN